MNSSAHLSMAEKADPLAVFDSFYARYRSAVSRSPILCYTYQIAGYCVQLCFAGGILPPLLTPALAHLAIPDVARPDLTICLWESETTGVQPPLYTWSSDQMGLRGEVHGYSNERILTAIQTDVAAVSLLDRERSLGIFWIDSAESLQVYERAAPLKVLLHWWLRERGLPMIHAGAVGTEEGAVGTAAGAVLLLGKTGAGKSTTSLACLEAGLDFICDDRCLLQLGAVPSVHAIYDSAKLHPEQMERFPNLLASVRNRPGLDEEKILVHVHEIAPRQMARCLPVRALLLARVAGRPETTLSTVSRMEVLREFTTSTLVYQPGAMGSEVRSMAELVRRVPCYQIDLGSHLPGIPSVIRELIDGRSR